MQALIPQTDPLRALVNAYDVWHEIDPELVADRDRVVLQTTKALDIEHNCNVYAVRDALVTRQYPIMLKKDVSGSLVKGVTGATSHVRAGAATFGLIRGDALRKLVCGNATAGMREDWKTVYAYILRNLDGTWKDDVLSFFDNGVSKNVAKSVKPREYASIFVSSAGCDLVEIDGVMDAFDAFMDEIRALRIERKLAVVGVDPITGKDFDSDTGEATSLVSTMMYAPVVQALLGGKILENNGPLTSNTFQERTANFFGATRFTKHINVSDITDFKSAAMLDYMVRQGHSLKVGNEIFFWLLSGELLDEVGNGGMTLIDIDNIGKYMFALYQGRHVPEKATFGHLDDGTDIVLNVWRITGNGARPVYKGVKSYSWNTLVHNHKSWMEDTYLWSCDNDNSPDAVAMRAGIDGYWFDRNGKRAYQWGLADALNCEPSPSADINAELRDELVRMCVDGVAPSHRFVMSLSQAMQAYQSTRKNLVRGENDFDFKIVQTMRARLAKCVYARSCA